MSVENRPIKNCDSGRINDYQMQQLHFPLWNFYQKNEFLENFLLSKGVFHHRSSSIKGRLPQKVVSIKSNLLLKPSVPSVLNRVK